MLEDSAKGREIVELDHDFFESCRRRWREDARTRGRPLRVRGVHGEAARLAAGGGPFPLVFLRSARSNMGRRPAKVFYSLEELPEELREVFKEALKAKQP